MQFMLSLAVVAICLWCPWPCETLDTKRGVDQNPLEATVMQQSQLIAQLQAQMAELEARLDRQEEEVAFSAHLTNRTVENISRNDTIIFEETDMNRGNGYDKQTGVFMAPVAGLYLFTLKITHIPPGNFHVYIVKQGHVLAEVEAGGDDRYKDRSSTTVVIHLQSEQRVWVRREGGTATHLQGNYASTFTGLLIKAD